MVDLAPFRGLRYRLDGSNDVSSVIAPPYDVISPAQQDALYERSPYNVIRLEYRREPAPERYALAARDLSTWRGKAGVLVAEPAPALYRYEQRFTHDGREYRRTAVIGRVRLEPLERGLIRPHEYTMARPKEDRLALLRATRANISPIYALLNDASHRFMRALHEARGGEATIGRDILGQDHQIEAITDRDAIAALRDSLAGEPLYIADGHHRYETALAYQAERPDDPSAGWIMMAISAADDPGLLILPIHRVVRPRRALADLQAGLRAVFDLEDGGSLDDAAAVRRVQSSLHASRSGLTLAALGVQPGQITVLRLRDRSAVEAQMPADRAPAWKALAVNVLQFGILEPLLGIDAETLQAGEHVEFTEDAAEAAAAVREGRAPYAFLVPATRADEIIAVANAGDRMPQKSTYFYPKLGTGLVLNAHDVE
jgi:uncharacterized protein (DUF1015 family)